MALPALEYYSLHMSGNLFSKHASPFDLKMAAKHSEIEISEKLKKKLKGTLLADRFIP